MQGRITLLLCILVMSSPLGFAQIQSHSYQGGRDVVEGEPAFNGRDESSASGVYAGGAGEVIMYSAAWCGVCARARQFFQANAIPFREYDIEKTAKGRDDYRQLGGTGVPVILVGDYLIQGFSEQRFMRLYRQ